VTSDLIRYFYQKKIFLKRCHLIGVAFFCGSTEKSVGQEKNSRKGRKVSRKDRKEIVLCRTLCFFVLKIVAFLCVNP